MDTFDHRGVRCVIVDLNAAKVQEAELAALRMDVPALVGDVRLPETLALAGLDHSHCAGVVALTNDDHANLSVAATVKLLRPGLPVICRCESDLASSSMQAFDTDHIVDPFALFGEHLAMALKKPGHYLLREWLTAAPDETLREPLFPPVGNWVLCGFGRFGARTARSLSAGGNAVTIVEAEPDVAQAAGAICGQGTERSVLEHAGVGSAVGIIAGTGSDVINLSIVRIARQMSPGIFTVVRSNQRSSTMLFEAAGASVAVQPAMVVVHACIAHLMAPALARFLEAASAHDNAWANELLARIAGITDERVPEIWSATVDASEAPAVLGILGVRAVTLDAVVRDPQFRDDLLPVLALALERNGSLVLLPPAETALEPGDRILFCGRGRGRRKQVLTLRNDNVLRYVLTGRDVPGGWVWRKVTHQTAAQGAAPTSCSEPRTGR
ncbi:MAG: NAD-binding protein [Betaproteobacteria bacterium]|nr:NAD-binding protein [Betaproteobacteria bacterium]